MDTGYWPRGALLLVLALFTMASSCDDEYSCSGACSHLAYCESEWLEDEGEPPLSEDERRHYEDVCMADCRRQNDYDELECVEESSCDALLDGKCSD